VRRRAWCEAVVNAFFEDPYQKPRKIAERVKLAANTVDSVLRDLQGRGIVSEVTGRNWGRVYVCNPVFDAVFHPVTGARAANTPEPPQMTKTE
jgi:hypothetical protein